LSSHSNDKCAGYAQNNTYQFSIHVMKYFSLSNNVKDSVTKYKLKECHPPCVYQNYNGLIINNGSKKHNCICK